MFVKGLLYGIVVALISLYVLFRCATYGVHVSPGESVSYDLRSLYHLAIPFFGGMGTGFLLVPAIGFGGIYGLYLLMGVRFSHR